MASLNSIGGLHYEMMRRCYNEKSVAYKDYGAKGIGVCKEWHNRDTFRKWCNDNGYVKGLRINRIDSNKNYCPENCVLGNKNSFKTGVCRKTREIKAERKEMKEKYCIPDNYSKLRIYRIFIGMHKRCEDETHQNYKNYGKRGISVCDEWSGKYGFFKFYKWSMDNGYTDKLSIDRINSNGNYEPNNCRWISINKQLYNRRCSLSYEYNGTILNLGEICKIENLKYGLVYSRIRKGMTLHDAISDVKKSIKSKG